MPQLTRKTLTTRVFAPRVAQLKIQQWCLSRYSLSQKLRDHGICQVGRHVVFAYLCWANQVQTNISLYGVFLTCWLSLRRKRFAMASGGNSHEGASLSDHRAIWVWFSENRALREKLHPSVCWSSNRSWFGQATLPMPSGRSNFCQPNATDPEEIAHRQTGVAAACKAQILPQKSCLPGSWGPDTKKLDPSRAPIWLRRWTWKFILASQQCNHITHPPIFLEMRSQTSAVLASLDVKDAFLTVDQQEPTLVHTADAAGRPQSLSLGKVLPGQRDGSLLWYRDITSYLKLQLGMEEHAAYPCLLRSSGVSCAVLIHVDDLLVVARKDFVMYKLLVKRR